MKDILMRRNSFFILFVLFCFFACAEDEAPLPIEKIKISLSTPEEINQALHDIQQKDPDSFKELMALKEKNDPDFPSRLHNHYYALKHKETLEKQIPPRPLGYYEKVKLSDTKIKELRDSFRKATDETQKSELEKKTGEAAAERFEIEFEFHKAQIGREEALLNVQKQRLADFEQNKDQYIQRLVTKTKSS